jgi:hypothetical protein
MPTKTTKKAPAAKKPPTPRATESPEPAPEEVKPLTKPAPIQRGLRIPRVPGS